MRLARLYLYALSILVGLIYLFVINEAVPFGLASRAETDILAAANRNLDRLDTSNAPATNQGKLACAWAVNRIVKEATGSDIGGGVSTIEMFKALQRGRGIQITPFNDARPGSIIISPTEGPVIGHVGILAENGRIYSNSSTRARFENNYSIDSWEKYYTGKGLKTYAFSIK